MTESAETRLTRLEEGMIEVKGNTRAILKHLLEHSKGDAWIKVILIATCVLVVYKTSH